MGFPAYLKESENLLKQAVVSATNPADETGYPLGNIIDLPVSKPLRILNRSTNKVHFTFPRAVEIEFFLLNVHNLSPTASITLRAGSSFDSEAGVSESITWKRRKSFIVLSSSETFQYWSIEITDEENPWGFLEIGYAMAGMLNRLTFDFQEGWTPSYPVLNLEDQSQTGTPQVDNISDWETLEINFDRKTETERETLRDLYLDLKRNAEPLFFIPDIDENNGFFGRITNQLSQPFPHAKGGTGESEHRVSTRLSLREDPPGKTIVKALPVVKSGLALPTGSTFSRASVANRKNADLVIVQQPTGEIRDPHYFDNGKRGFLLEPAVTPLAGIASPEDFSSGWNTSELSVSTDQTDEPKESPSGNADKLVESSNTTAHTIDDSVTISADDWISWSCFFKADERDWVRLVCYESGGAANRFEAWFDLANAAVGTSQVGGTGSNVNAGIESYGDGWYRCLLRGKVNNSATTIVCAIALATADAESSYNGDGSSGLYAWGAQAEERIWPTSYMGGTARAIDQLEVPFAFAPQAMTFYGKMVDLGTGLADTNLRVFQIPGSANSNPSLILFHLAGSSVWRVQHHNGSSSVTSSVAVGDVFDEIELLAQLYPSGAVQVHLITAGSKSSGSKSSGLSFASAWAAENMRLNQVAGTFAGAMLFSEAKFYRGVRDENFMRAL